MFSFTWTLPSVIPGGTMMVDTVEPLEAMAWAVLLVYVWTLVVLGVLLEVALAGLLTLPLEVPLVVAAGVRISDQLSKVPVL